MNYEKLVNNLRRKAYDYTGVKENQFKRVLLEAKKRKVKNHVDSEQYQNYYSKQQDNLLFKLN